LISFELGPIFFANYLVSVWRLKPVLYNSSLSRLQSESKMLLKLDISLGFHVLLSALIVT